MLTRNLVNNRIGGRTTQKYAYETEKWLKSIVGNNYLLVSITKILKLRLYAKNCDLLKLTYNNTNLEKLRIRRCNPNSCKNSDILFCYHKF